MPKAPLVVFENLIVTNQADGTGYVSNVVTRANARMNWSSPRTHPATDYDKHNDNRSGRR